MERFGVGRPAVREALQSLHTMGLITISHGERSRVNALSADAVLRQGDAIARMLLSTGPQNLEHLKEARRLFEIGMVRAGTPKATPEDVAELRALIDRQRSRLGDPSAFIGADIDFHRRIAQLSGNPICSGRQRGDARLAVPVPLRSADLVRPRGHHPRRARGDRRRHRGE